LKRSGHIPRSEDLWIGLSRLQVSWENSVFVDLLVMGGTKGDYFGDYPSVKKKRTLFPNLCNGWNTK
jgi:hypothetical protein